MIKVVVVNGRPESGKTTFEMKCRELVDASSTFWFDENKRMVVDTISTVDFINGGIAFQICDQFNHRYIWCWYANCHAVQFTRQFRQYQSNCLGGTCAGWNHGQVCRTCTSKIFVVFIQ